MKKPKGICYIAGAGPGDLGLVTLRTRDCVERADVIIYDYLSNPEILGWAREGTEVIHAGKRPGEHRLTQEEINALLVERTAAGKVVVRLKGGIPSSSGGGARRPRR